MTALHYAMHQGAHLPHPPCRNVKACRFLLWTCHDFLGGKRWFGWNQTHKSLICFLWRPALGGLLRSPSCSPPAQLPIFCSTAGEEQLIHITLNVCGGMKRFMSFFPTPYPPPLFSFPSTSAFPELEGQKFKSCLEQLLTCYQLLHIASTGCILTISLEMSLLKFVFFMYLILRRASFELHFLYW